MLIIVHTLFLVYPNYLLILLYKNTVDILDDGFEILIGKRMVAAAAFSGPHGLHGVFQWCTALRMPRLPASRTSRHRKVPP